MMVLIVYDICTKSSEGRKRLRNMEKICGGCGVPVQNSVFECELNADEYRSIKKQIEGMVSKEVDSVRFYLLGNKYQNKIVYAGKETLNWNRENYVV